MKVVLLTTQVPFTFGGAEIHVQNLKGAIQKAGHKCEIIQIPFKWYPPEKIVDHILISRLIDLSESNGDKIDLVIGLRFPAYLVPHSNKKMWIIHQHRPAYELWNTKFCDLMHFPNGREVRDAIRRADTKHIQEAREIYTNSHNVSKRLKRYNDIESTPLYHPPGNAESFYKGKSENYVFFPSRLTEIKRQDLAVSAMKYVKTDTKLVIAGLPDNPDFEEYLKRLIKKENVSDRVELLGGVSEEEKLDLYANARAILYPPLDEDYGYVTLEGMLSHKPVITCRDSGGSLEFIEDGRNGFVRDSSPEDLADAINLVGSNKEKSIMMGDSGREKFDSMNITWENVVEVLLQ